jgi:hypothetical protein
MTTMNKARLVNTLSAAAIMLAGCNRPAPPPAATTEAKAAAAAPCAVAPAPSAPNPSPATAAVAVPTGAPKPAPRADAKDLQVKRLVMAKAVTNREPVDVATSFSADDLDRLYAYVEVENKGAGDGEILVSFEPPDGPAQGNVALNVGPSPRWRTWAFTRSSRKPGSWHAVVKSSDGRVLARAPFEITEG